MTALFRRFVLPEPLPPFLSMSQEKVSSEKNERESDNGSEIDLLSFHEQRAGRLIVDPEYVVCLPDRNFVGFQRNVSQRGQD